MRQFAEQKDLNPTESAKVLCYEWREQYFLRDYVRNKGVPTTMASKTMATGITSKSADFFRQHSA